MRTTCPKSWTGWTKRAICTSTAAPFPWKLADDFAEDKRWGYPKWKVVLGKLAGKGR